MRKFQLMLLLCLALAPGAHADEQMEQEIDHLLDAVAQSQCVFIRNGKEHGPQAAKDHLSLKRRRGKRYYSSADEFVERLASSSSWTGKPYFIRCGAAGEQLASEWFGRILAEYRGAP